MPGQTGRIEQPTSGTEIVNELGMYLEKLAVEDKFSGVVLVANYGKPIFQRAYGMANKGGNIPNKARCVAAVSALASSQSLGVSSLH